MNLQPTHLHNSIVKLTPLLPSDFERLYTAASDPLIWEQHPTKDRYKRDVFENFFRGGIESCGAFIITDVSSTNVIGSSRFYNLNIVESSIHIGYTFFTRNCWGKGHNKATKELMLQYAFEFVDTVFFQIGATNYRSQQAITKIGGLKIGEEATAYFGEGVNLNFIYAINKIDWHQANA